MKLDTASPVVLHVIESLSAGGASRSLFSLIKALKRIDTCEHKVLVLERITPEGKELAISSQVSVIQSAIPEEWRREVSAADIVQLHFWNSPILYKFIEMDLPPTRAIIWSHVNGFTLPHIITDELLSWGDVFVSSTEVTLEQISASTELKDVRRKLLNITEAADFEQIDVDAFKKSRLEKDRNFIVGYIGTVDFTKLHQDYVRMSSSVQNPLIKFSVYGSGGGFKDLAAEARQLGAEQRFFFGGYARNVAAVLGTFNIFGYPLVSDTYCTSELILQECLYLGVVPVVLNHGGAAKLIKNNYTGIVVESQNDYKYAIEFLYKNPDEVQRLSKNAISFARDNLGAEKVAEQFAELYSEVIKAPKERRHQVQKLIGAHAFARSLGYRDPVFKSALDDPALLHESTNEILNKINHTTLSADSGGILHYRRYYPQDGVLALWSGAALMRQGRLALAAAEFKRANQLGVNHQLTEEYLKSCLYGLTSSLSKVSESQLEQNVRRFC